MLSDAGTASSNTRLLARMNTAIGVHPLARDQWSIRPLAMRSARVEGDELGDGSRDRPLRVRWHDRRRWPGHRKSTPSTWSTRPLGTTGMNITRVGFGAWALGGADWAYSWGAQDDIKLDRRHPICHRARHQPDGPAAAYGLGHSEEVVALALTPASLDSRPALHLHQGRARFGTLPTARCHRGGWPHPEHPVEVEQSLRRPVAPDRIDLLHSSTGRRTTARRSKNYRGALLELQASGKIGAAGLSNHSVDQLELADKLDM